MAEVNEGLVAPEATNESVNEQTNAQVENTAEENAQDNERLTGQVIRIFYNKKGTHCLAFSKRFSDSIVEDIEDADNKTKDIVPIRENYIRRQLVNQIDDYADLEAVLNDNEESIGYGSLQRILKDATVTLTKVYHVAGETYKDRDGNDVVYTDDGWNIEIGTIRLSKSAFRFIEKLFDKA